MNIYLVIPAYNEQSRLLPVLRRSLRHFSPEKIIVVDDGSLRPLKLKNPITLLRHQVNLGKGAALKTGIEYALKQGADAVILMDADGQHDPAELPHFIEYLNLGYDLVFGSRRKTLNIPLVRFLGNKFASVYINLLFGIYVGDLLCGYRALTKKAYRLILWESPHYGVETEMVARLGKAKDKLKWIEIPVSTIYVDKYKGVTIIDAFKVLTNTIWWKLS